MKSIHVGLSGFLKHVGFLISPLKLCNPQKLFTKLFDNSALKSPPFYLFIYLFIYLFELYVDKYAKYTY